jgi:DmsE family decaheme c-type cytochrome
MSSRLFHLTIYVAGLILFQYSGTIHAAAVDWVSLNPELSGATPVGNDEECRDCHEDYMKTYATTRHARVIQGGCESCHGPMSKHIDAPRREPALTVSFKPEGGVSPAGKSSICLQCHEGTRRTYWQGGPHEVNDVTCNACHYTMARRSDNSLSIAEDASSVCLTCHIDKRGQILKTSHMPVREGKMDCASCHNPHGSYGPKLLKEATVNETCYTCHAEKRGPFLWEHAPARENCANCHDAHGSNNTGMLKTKGAFLCLSCHQYGGHVNAPRYNRVNATVGQGCANCHSRVHGSNHPSGSKLTR